MERVRIDEMVLKYRDKHGNKPTHAEIGAFVFKGEKGRPRNGKRHKLSDSRKSWLITRWNTGKDLTALKPRHLFRLAAYFNVTTLAELLSDHTT